MFGPDVGVWRIVLNPQPAGGPNTIAIMCTTTEGASQTIQLKDILFGDVWVCSGQSNMQFPVKEVHFFISLLPLGSPKYRDQKRQKISRAT